MSVDPKIKEAIEKAVAEAGQTEGLTRKLTRWFEAISSGNEDVSDTQSSNRHLELLYDEAQPSETDLDKLLEDLLAESDDEQEAP